MQKKTSLLLNSSNRKGCYREVPLAFDFIKRVFEVMLLCSHGFFQGEVKVLLKLYLRTLRSKFKSQGFCLPFSIYHFSRWREGVFINNTVIFTNKELLKLVGEEKVLLDM